MGQLQIHKVSNFLNKSHDKSFSPFNNSVACTACGLEAQFHSDWTKYSEIPKEPSLLMNHPSQLLFRMKTSVSFPHNWQVFSLRNIISKESTTRNGFVRRICLKCRHVWKAKRDICIFLLANSQHFPTLCTKRVAVLVPESLARDQAGNTGQPVKHWAKSCSFLTQRPSKYLPHLHTLSQSRDYCQFPGVSFCGCGGEKSRAPEKTTFCYYKSKVQSFFTQTTPDFPSSLIWDELSAWINLCSRLPCCVSCLSRRGFVVPRTCFSRTTTARITPHDKYNVESWASGLDKKAGRTACVRVCVSAQARHAASWLSMSWNRCCDEGFTNKSKQTLSHGELVE